MLQSNKTHLISCLLLIVKFKTPFAVNCSQSKQTTQLQFSLSFTFFLFLNLFLSFSKKSFDQSSPHIYIESTVIKQSGAISLIYQSINQSSPIHLYKSIELATSISSNNSIDEFTTSGAVYCNKKNILLFFACQHISNKIKNTSTVHSNKASAPLTVSSSSDNQSLNLIHVEQFFVASKLAPSL
jgi:hypothetical protein